MDRRSLLVLLALVLATASAPAASAASLDELLAGAPATGTISDDPADAEITAQTPKGTLSDTPTKATGGSSSSSSTTSSVATATADALPFTGSDPRITLLLGVAALLAGAGLRLRTGDARDY